MMEKKFKALRTIGTIYYILGIFVSIVTILCVIGICATTTLGGALDSTSKGLGNYGSLNSLGLFSGALGGLLINIFVLINGGGLALMFFAISEGIYVLLSLEENTRATALLLNREPAK